MALSALCDDTDWGRTWSDVLQHRFSAPEGHTGEFPLDYHALGNLLIVTLWELLGDPVAGLDWVGALLHARGYRYRVDFAPWSNKRRRADIVFTRRRLAVFIDGCFWHGCPEHGTIPVSHADYWEPKLVKNRERDAETTAMAEAEGWKVLRIWEHVPPEEAVQLVVRELDNPGSAVREREE